MKKTTRFFALYFGLILTLCCLFYLSGCSSKKKERTSYKIECELNGSVLTGHEKVNFYNHTDNAFKELKFNLYPNAFREGALNTPFSEQYVNRAYYDGLNYGNIEILSVTADKKSVEYCVSGKDNNVLSVKLLKEVYPEEYLEIEVDFKTTLPKVVARMGINKDAINLANFYPILCGIEDGKFYECVYYSCGDPFFSDVADYEVSLTCDENFKVASSGKLVKVDGKSRTYKIENARNFAFVLSNKFSVASTKHNDVEIFYYYYDDAEKDKSLKIARESLEYFEKTFGEYPHKTYSVCQTEFLQGGMEYSGLVVISDELEPNAYREVIVHETAHQWWMGLVGNNEIKYGFLDEGLAEYSVISFYERHKEYNMTRENMVLSSEKTYKAFCSVYDKLFGKVNTRMCRALDEFSSEYEYVNIAYIKPVIMYDTLRKSIGDERFFSSLKKYVQEMQYKNATPDDLIGAFERAGSKTEGFLRSFFDGKVVI